MNIVVIKYNAGNIMSVSYALQRMGITPNVTANRDEILNADKVIFPGVGEASTTMNYLRLHKLDEIIREIKQPFLGICLGMQLMCSHSEEGDVECLGIFDEKVKKFDKTQAKEHIKVPHMGWNSIYDLKNGIFDASLESQYVYFVHSYYVSLGADTAAKTEYIHPFSSGLQKDNYYATQFHPEKSGTVGAKILENFIKL